MEQNQTEILHQMLSYRMLQVCEKHLDNRDKLRPHSETRKKRYDDLINGILSHGLQFMYQLEMLTTYQAREEFIQEHIDDSLEWQPHLGLDFAIGIERSNELCDTRRILGECLQEVPRVWSAEDERMLRSLFKAGYLDECHEKAEAVRARLPPNEMI
ncbi:unnamed protein product [Clonostachys rosea]|uniref:Uncharacterized protein n=1 Tax=Bionectria ochroleuca TaxID=29856 RepID=A0ABY6UVH8_BIOOC|nr:unnamed protein product [Clonostachys rosea]